MSLTGLGHDEEFLMNVAGSGLGLKEIFSTKFENFLKQFMSRSSLLEEKL